MTQAMRLTRWHWVPRGRIAVLVFAVGGLVLTSVAGSASGEVASHAAKGFVISTLKTAKFGTILVNRRTLYTMTPSGAGCNAACQKYWLAVVLPKGVKKATAGAGVNASKLGTVKRSRAKLQVTYGGKALYWFALDNAPGQVKGNVTDTWGRWSVVVANKPAGSGPTSTTSPPSTTTTKPTTTTTKPTTPTTNPTTTTTVPGGGGVGF